VFSIHYHQAQAIQRAARLNRKRCIQYLIASKHVLNILSRLSSFFSFCHSKIHSCLEKAGMVAFSAGLECQLFAIVLISVLVLKSVLALTLALYPHLSFALLPVASLFHS